MATGLRLTPDGRVLVDFGGRRLPISVAEYRANGYKPSLKTLTDKPPASPTANNGLASEVVGRPLKRTGRPPLRS
jgi:hypothetical protein